MNGHIADLRAALDTLIDLEQLSPDEFEERIPSYVRSAYLTNGNTINDMKLLVRDQLYAETIREGAYQIFLLHENERRLESLRRNPES